MDTMDIIEKAANRTVMEAVTTSRPRTKAVTTSATHKDEVLRLATEMVATCPRLTLSVLEDAARHCIAAGVERQDARPMVLGAMVAAYNRMGAAVEGAETVLDHVWARTELHALSRRR